MEYSVIRSRRRTFSIQVTKSGVVIRAPLFASKKSIASFAEKYEDWARRRAEKLEGLVAEAEKAPLTKDDLERLAWEAMRVIPERARHFAGKIGVSYGRITVRCQRTRWGSCSAKGDLNFNCLLMLTPPEVLDSVVVHELCHIKHMDHSEAFYAEVLRACPDYYVWNRWLRENGKLLLLRVPRQQK